MWWRALIVLGCLALVALPAALGHAGEPYMPEIAKGSGQPHAEGNDYWRRHHMDLMTHDRDLTMYQGDRAVAASLGACFGCHAVRDQAGQPVTYRDPRHFCRSCHDFAAVQVDCFMCHRSTPVDFVEPLPRALLSPGKE